MGGIVDAVGDVVGGVGDAVGGVFDFAKEELLPIAAVAAPFIPGVGPMVSLGLNAANRVLNAPSGGMMSGGYGGSPYGGVMTGLGNAGIAYQQGQLSKEAVQEMIQQAQEYGDLASFRPIDLNLLSGTVRGTGDGLTVDLSKGYEDIFNQALTRAPTWMEGISQDPLEMQKILYGQQSRIFEPEMQRQNLALENRLRAQGMLGATGGAERTRSQLEAQDVARQKALISAYDLGQQAVDLAQQRQVRDLAQAMSVSDLERALAGQAIEGGKIRSAANLQAYAPLLEARMGGTQANLGRRTGMWDQLGGMGGGIAGDLGNLIGGGLSNIFGGGGSSMPYTPSYVSDYYMSGGYADDIYSGTVPFNPSNPSGIADWKTGTLADPNYSGGGMFSGVGDFFSDIGSGIGDFFSGFSF